MDIKELRKNLGIDDYLELVKEDRNCHGAYISFGQYMYLLEKENQALKKSLKASRRVAKHHLNRELDLENQQKEFIEWLENEIKNSDICDVYVHGMKFNSAEKMIYKDILSKYKETVGYKE